MNRLSRDEVLHAALDQADIASLDQHDRPNGVIVPNAHAIGWLQRGLDYFHALWPWDALVKSLAWTMTPGTATYEVNAAPINAAEDFLLDLKDGLLLSMPSGTGGVARPVAQGMPAYIQWRAAQGATTPSQGLPQCYTLQGTQLLVWPTPDLAYPATLWYYSLPVVLKDGTKVPSFPNDDILVEYVRIRALEWATRLEPGDAVKYAQKVIGQLQTTRHGRQAEAPAIPLARDVFRPMTAADPTAWMGKTTA